MREKFSERSFRATWTLREGLEIVGIATWQSHIESWSHILYIIFLFSQQFFKDFSYHHCASGAVNIQIGWIGPTWIDSVGSRLPLHLKGLKLLDCRSGSASHKPWAASRIRKRLRRAYWLPPKKRYISCGNMHRLLALI